VKLHVLVEQFAASPVPPLKMPGVFGESALTRRKVPAAYSNVQVPPPDPPGSGLQTLPPGPITPTAPDTVPSVVMVSVTARAGTDATHSAAVNSTNLQNLISISLT